MIKFTVQQSMFDCQKIHLTWNIDHDKHTYGPVQVQISEVQQFKEKTVMKELYKIVRNMVIQRKQAYIHSGKATEAAFKAIQHLEYNLEVLRSTVMIDQFFTYLKNNILPHLAYIEPGKNSRFVNFTHILNSLTAFVEKYQAYQATIKATNLKREAKTA